MNEYYSKFWLSKNSNYIFSQFQNNITRLEDNINYITFYHFATLRELDKIYQMPILAYDFLYPSLGYIKDGNYYGFSSKKIDAYQYQKIFDNKFIIHDELHYHQKLIHDYYFSQFYFLSLISNYYYNFENYNIETLATNCFDFIFQTENIELPKPRLHWYLPKLYYFSKNLSEQSLFQFRKKNRNVIVPSSSLVITFTEEFFTQLKKIIFDNLLLPLDDSIDLTWIGNFINQKIQNISTKSFHKLLFSNIRDFYIYDLLYKYSTLIPLNELVESFNNFINKKYQDFLDYQKEEFVSFLNIAIKFVHIPENFINSLVISFSQSNYNWIKESYIDEISFYNNQILNTINQSININYPDNFKNDILESKIFEISSFQFLSKNFKKIYFSDEFYNLFSKKMYDALIKIYPEKLEDDIRKNILNFYYKFYFKILNKILTEKSLILSNSYRDKFNEIDFLFNLDFDLEFSDMKTNFDFKTILTSFDEAVVRILILKKYLRNFLLGVKQNDEIFI